MVKVSSIFVQTVNCKLFNFTPPSFTHLNVYTALNAIQHVRQYSARSAHAAPSLIQFLKTLSNDPAIQHTNVVSFKQQKAVEMKNKLANAVKPVDVVESADEDAVLSLSARVFPVFPDHLTALQSLFSTMTRPADVSGSSLNNSRSIMIHDLARPQRQLSRWHHNLPRVTPFYAVKCNPDSLLIECLANRGVSFDCASAAEIRAVLATGIGADRIIFANPIKSIADLKYSHSVNVRRMTFDNVEELVKIKKYAPDAEVVLRLLADDSGSLMRFGSKFGAAESDCHELLTTAKQLGLSVVGTSFHIGSGCFDPSKYDAAIALSRRAHDLAVDVGLPALTLVDIGGGFSGEIVGDCANNTTRPSFESFATVINTAIDKYFSDVRHVNFIAEPGRYFATGMSTLFTMVQGKRAIKKTTADDTLKPRFLYYVNDSVYGSCNNTVFDHAKLKPETVDKLFKKSVDVDVISNVLNASKSTVLSFNTSFTHSFLTAPKYAHARAVRHSSSQHQPTIATIFGNTCDSIDMLVKDYEMNGELNVGDWLVFESMGAYTQAAASNFNGMQKPINVYCKSNND